MDTVNERDILNCIHRDALETLLIDDEYDLAKTSKNPCSYDATADAKNILKKVCEGKSHQYL